MSRFGSTRYTGVCAVFWAFMTARQPKGLGLHARNRSLDGFFMLSRDKKSTDAALNRFFNLENEKTGMYYWRGQKIKIDDCKNKK